MNKKRPFDFEPLRRNVICNHAGYLAGNISKADIRYILIVVMMLSGLCYSQSVNFNLNNDTNVHTYSLPVHCPSTAPGDLSTCASNGNQSLTGAGSVFPECDLNPSAECSVPGPPYNANAVHVIRVTDANTGGTNTPYLNYHPQPSQGAGDVVWDATSTRFVVTESGNYQVPFSFDPNPASGTYLKPTKLYGAGYLINTTTAAFSKVPPPYTGGQTVSLLYAIQNASNVSGLTGHGSNYVIMSYDFSSTTTAPTIANGGIKLVADLNQAAHCVPAGYTAQAQSVLSVSDDDQTFAALIGPQDTGVYVVAWNRTLGCSVWKTDTATVTTFSGSTGTITDAAAGVPVKFYVHEVQIFHDGSKVYVEGTPGGCVPGNTCDSGNNFFQRWVWEDGIPYAGNLSPTGLTTWPTGSYSNCGHNMQGYNIQINRCPYTSGDGDMAIYGRPANGWSQSALNPNAIPWGAYGCYQRQTNSSWSCPADDAHFSWANNVDGTDTAPIFETSTANEDYASAPNSLVNDTPFTPWDNEIEILATNCYPNCTSANTPWRVAHTYSASEVTHAAGFADYIAIGSVSSRPAYGQYFVIFTSNWQGQLGCTSGTYSSTAMGLGCPGGNTGMRYDAFIATVPIATGNGYLLTATKSGQGTVTSSDGYINCGSTCSYNYNSGTQVTLTATASSGYTFSNWAGCDSVQSNTCTVTVNNARTVTATFTSNGYVLTVSKSGQGTVTSNDGYINCGSSCSHNYNSGTQVTLTAAASSGYTFSNWAGCDSVQSNTCTVTVNNARTVTATFTSNGYVLTVSKSGQGTVTSNDGYINCGSSCSHNYNSGTQVTLTAAASSGLHVQQLGGMRLRAEQHLHRDHEQCPYGHRYLHLKHLPADREQDRAAERLPAATDISTAAAPVPTTTTAAHR